MAQVSHEGISASYEPVVGRRTFLKIAGGVGVIAAGVGMFNVIEDINNPHHTEKDELTQNFDIYEGRDWANPRQLLGLTHEQLQDIAAVPITKETRTNKGFAKVFAEKLELFFNAGMILERVQDAAEAEAAGESYGDIVRQSLGEPMSEGLFIDEYDGRKSTKVIEGIKNYQAKLAGIYEYRLSDSEYNKATANTTMYITLPENSVEPLSSNDDGRRLSLTMTFRSPSDLGGEAVGDIPMTARLVSDYESMKYKIYMESFNKDLNEHNN